MLGGYLRLCRRKMQIMSLKEFTNYFCIFIISLIYNDKIKWRQRCNKASELYYFLENSMKMIEMLIK